MAQREGCRGRGTPACPACLWSGPGLPGRPLAHDQEMLTLGISAVMAGPHHVSFYVWAHQGVSMRHTDDELLVQHPIHSSCSHWQEPDGQPLLWPPAATSQRAALLTTSPVRLEQDAEKSPPGSCQKHLHLQRHDMTLGAVCACAGEPLSAELPGVLPRTHRGPGAGRARHLGSGPIFWRGLC